VIKIKKIVLIIFVAFAFIEKTNAEIKDSLYIIVGNKAITKLDIVNEIKIILILNNQSYSDDNRDVLNEMAIKSAIKRNVKKIAIELNSFLEYSKDDFNKELMRLASNINMDLDTLKNVCASNDLDFSLIEDQVKVELLWNSLIFQIYKDRLSINVEEIDDQLKLIQNQKDPQEYLISEIVIKNVERDKLDSVVADLKKKIETEGFENVAMNLSISETAVKGGDLGWINENIIGKKFKKPITKTPVGSLSDAILLPEGILIFKVRDKRQAKKSLSLEETKNRLVNAEKTKILRMYSMSHYDTLKRSVAVKFFK